MLFRGRRTTILRDGQRCGEAIIKGGTLTQMRLVGNLFGYVTRISFEPLEEHAIRSGDRLRVVPIE